LTQTKSPQGVSLRDILALSHVFNAISSAITVIVGYLVTVWAHNAAIAPVPMLGAALATLFISSAGFIVNDIIDIEIDRINRPDRVLASGQISIPMAWGLYILYNVIGLGLAFATTNPPAGAIAILVGAALFFYSFWFKRMFLIGHITVAVMGALLLPFGGLAANHLLPSLYIAPIVLLAFLAREILKTVPDVEGDRANNVINIATRFGPEVAAQVARVILGLTAVLLLVVPLGWQLNPLYYVVVVVVIWPVCLVAIFRSTSYLLRISKMLFLMVAAALLLGSIH
jgi:geranylgeranylglycerol-phosphate geranylgeranyltransferase